MDLKERLEQHRAEEQRLAWEGTFLEYFEIVKRNPAVADLAHARVYNMIMSAGVEKNADGQKTYKFFSDEIFGLEKPLEQLVEYFRSAAKRLEVSSTTLPQLSIPRVMGDPRYQEHLDRRRAMFAERADEMMAAFEGCRHVTVNKPGGAFYFTVRFDEGVLNDTQSLPIDDPAIRQAVERMVAGVEPDKRFVYYLMGATGIVVVPLTGFQSTHHGFRATLLETDDAHRAWVFRSLREAIDRYVGC